MKNKLSTLTLAISLAGAALLGGASTAQAATTWGTVTFVGTIGEAVVNGTYAPQMRIRVHGTCDGDATPKDRWIHINGGRADGIYAHNGVNMKNAYGTLLAAMLSGKSVQIDGISTCNTASTATLSLWAGNVGMY